MIRDKSYFDLEQIGGIYYPIVRRNKGSNKIIECPFCCKSHSHSLGDGHKNSHCDGANVIIKGIEIPCERGYIIKDIE